MASNKLPQCKLDFVREDDFVEYYLFPQLTEDLTKEGIELNENELVQARSQLDSVLKVCNDIVTKKVDELKYIWHKDEFHLQIRTGSVQERQLSDDGNVETAVDNALPPHLYGVMHYGDNITDEWFVVHLLSELTSQVSGLIARVVDADGEFLLIEAADFLPDWANPETCEQRVYIVDGTMHLVQNSPSNTTALLPVSKAIMKLRNNSKLHRVSNEIQKCISARMLEFKDANNCNYHRQIVRLPVAAASILKERPMFIAPAIRAFCERDAVDMKACRSMRFFPPEQQRVRTCVRFTRCLYAMLMNSNYTPDRKIGWNLSNDTKSEEYKEDLLGVKIACGFEILASQGKDASNNDENDPTWRNFVQSLTAKGYFRANLVGSAEYSRLLNEAKVFFQESQAGFRTASTVGSDILAILKRLDVSSESVRDEENNLEPSDPDDWLNITPEQLDAMLLERYGPKKLYKGNGDINAEEFTKNLADFLDKESGFDGIDSDDDTEPEEEDDDRDHKRRKLHKRKEEFKNKVKKNNSMRKACNRNSLIENDRENDTIAAAEQKTSTGIRKSNNSNSSGIEQQQSSTHVRDFLEFVIPEDNWESNSEMSDYEDEDDLERNIEAMTNADMNIDLDIQAYMRQMDKELAKTTIGKSFEPKDGAGKNPSSSGAAASATIDDDFDDIESFEPININVNTLKNMLDSYKSQIGGPGPVSHLLNAMGVGMSTAAATSDTDTDDLKESTV